MGQTPSGPVIVPPLEKADIVCEVFSQGVVHASHKLRHYLGFQDPHGTLHPTTETLTDIFLVDFITFCVEKSVEERIHTSKMTAQQAALFGVDWIWTLLGPDRSMRLQIAEIRLTDSYKERSRYEKLEEFCRLVGPDCLGLFMVFGSAEKPKDIRGILLESVSKEKKNGAPGERALKQYILDTDTFLPTRDLLDACISRRNGQRNIGKVYINFL
ncbi:unnamed protein product [Ranitomeya imitator]|uniref:Rab15 effector protein n=1 Tax=Ranitomeya imitator TaxID=111125 RepID=A0ABN9LX70_9NEOB|nr:unnamed protein product [Ranitomeya imitator]